MKVPPSKRGTASVYAKQAPVARKEEVDKQDSRILRRSGRSTACTAMPG